MFPHRTIDKSVLAWRKLALGLRTRVLEAVADPTNSGQASINRIAQALLSQFDLTIVFPQLRSSSRCGHRGHGPWIRYGIGATPSLHRIAPFSWYRFDASFETRPAIAEKMLFLPLHGSVHFANFPSSLPDGEAGDPRAHPLEPVWAADLGLVRAAWPTTSTNGL